MTTVRHPVVTIQYLNIARVIDTHTTHLSIILLTNIVDYHFDNFITIIQYDISTIIDYPSKNSDFQTECYLHQNE